jgi:radical SAM superfamily enzyme YgiQ (UPF0313 family)
LDKGKIFQNEVNNIIKKRFDYHIALLYPSTYRSSLSSLGYQLIYFYLNSFEEIFAERVITESRGDYISIETGTPLSKFDIIFASAHYELEYPEIIRTLLRSRISPLKEERNRPILIIGGPSPTANPFPMGKVADFIFRGEFESTGKKFFDSIQYIDNPKKFKEMLSSIEGFWSLENRTEKISIVKDLDSSFFPIIQIQNPHTEPILGKGLMVETSRGCNRGCFFCMESAISLFRRERSENKIIELIERGLEVNNLNRVIFFSLSFFDSALGEKILKYVVDRGIEASIPSVRIDSLDDNKIELIKKAGQKTLTVAPETGIYELRKSIGKPIKDEMILQIAEKLKALDMGIKLYYMIGLPGERQSDLDAIIAQVEYFWKTLRNKKKIKVSVNPFIPKPLTKMENEKMEEANELQRKIDYLNAKLSKISEFEYYPPKLARLQYTINSLGENAHVFLIEHALKKIRD